MVRSASKQTPDEKKDTKKKSSSAGGGAKKKSDTGNWPCKMDGCKKVFAREADLKRHQRTTKSHSIPGFQCPQCDATFTRTDALRRHQKSRHNGVVIEPAEQDKSKHNADGLSSGSRSPSPGASPSRSHGEGSTNGSPPAGQSSSAHSSNRAASYYRPHTMQDGYFATYPPSARPPPPGMLIDPHYPPPPIALPTSATRGNWHPQPPAPPPWVPDGHHPMPPPPPGMYIPSYYPSPYYRHPGMPGMPPQVDPGLLAQSNAQPNGVGPPESALRNTSAESPKHDEPASDLAPPSMGSASARGTQQEGGAGADGEGNGESDALMAAAALQAVLAFQKEQEAAKRSAAADSQQQRRHDEPIGQAGPQGASDGAPSASASAGAAATPDRSRGEVRVERPPDVGPSSIPVVQGDPVAEDNPDLDAVGEDDQELTVGVDDIVHAAATESPHDGMDHLVSDDGTPMLNPEELLTQESLASPPPS